MTHIKLSSSRSYCTECNDLSSPQRCNCWVRHETERDLIDIVCKIIIYGTLGGGLVRLFLYILGY